MRVVATRLGYYEHLRRYPAEMDHPRAGEPFEIRDEKDFSRKWMRKLDGSEPVLIDKPPQTIEAKRRGRPPGSGKKEVS